MRFNGSEDTQSTANAPIGLILNAFHRRWWRSAPHCALYQVTDCLHEGRTVNVPAPEIAGTVAGWLAELGVHSPLVDELARAVREGDWPAARAIGEHLSVDVTFAS